MRGNQKNKNYIIKWTPKFAYAIGLLTTDGNLANDGRHFIFVSKDKQLIEVFKKCLNLDSKICKKKGGFNNKKRYYRIQFSNTLLYKYLLSIGLGPNKSKNIGLLKIPNKYFFDFLRGHFDGDGSCYSFWDKRWINSFMFYTSFTSGSLKHIEWLQKKINKLINIKGSIHKGINAWKLEYAKKDSQVLWKKIYYKNNVPCLLRKFEKIKKILKVQAQMA